MFFVFLVIFTTRNAAALWAELLFLRGIRQGQQVRAQVFLYMERAPLSLVFFFLLLLFHFGTPPASSHAWKHPIIIPMSYWKRRRGREREREKKGKGSCRMIGYDHLTPTTTDRLHPASSTSTFCVIDFPWSWGNKFLFFFSSFCVWQLQECQIYIYLFVYVCVCLKATPRRRRWGFGGFEQHTTVRQRENIDAITRRPLYRLCSCVPSCAAQSSLMMSVNEPRLFLSFFRSFFFFFFSTVISCTSNLLLFFSLLFSLSVLLGK